MTSTSLALSTWAIDPDHSFVEFSLQSRGVGCFSTRFRRAATSAHVQTCSAILAAVANARPLRVWCLRQKLYYITLCAEGTLSHA